MINKTFLRRAIQLSEEKSRNGEGGPFGAVIVKDGEVISEGWNSVTTDCDPTAHAEVMAIRAACKKLNSFSLEGCEIYSSCEPCPMCLSAIYWSRLDRLYYGASRLDAADAGFDDELLYTEIPLPPEERQLASEQHLQKEAQTAFSDWKNNPNKTAY